MGLRSNPILILLLLSTFLLAPLTSTMQLILIVRGAEECEFNGKLGEFGVNA